MKNLISTNPWILKVVDKQWTLESKCFRGCCLRATKTLLKHAFSFPSFRKPFVDCIRELFRNATAQTYHHWCWMCNYGPGVFLNFTASFPHGHVSIWDSEFPFWEEESSPSFIAYDCLSKSFATTISGLWSGYFAKFLVLSSWYLSLAPPLSAVALWALAS